MYLFIKILTYYYSQEMYPVRIFIVNYFNKKAYQIELKSYLSWAIASSFIPKLPNKNIYKQLAQTAKRKLFPFVMPHLFPYTAAKSVIPTAIVVSITIYVFIRCCTERRCFRNTWATTTQFAAFVWVSEIVVFKLVYFVVVLPDCCRYRSRMMTNVSVCVCVWGYSCV